MRVAELLSGAISLGLSAAAFAQAVPPPAPAGGAGAAAGTAGSQAATVQGVSEENKKAAVRGRSVDEQMTFGARRGGTPGYVPPMDIKIKDAGIALPKCAAESREGEACK